MLPAGVTGQLGCMSAREGTHAEPVGTAAVLRRGQFGLGCRMLRTTFCWLAFVGCAALQAAEGRLEPVTIQLRWSHQFQFAGYYAAKEKGFYAAEGLGVATFGRELPTVTPGDVDDHFREHQRSTSTKKQHLAALRKFFNLLVERHIRLINPAAAAQLERLAVVEGKTPQISPSQVTQLLRSIPTSKVTGLRDRAMICTLSFTGARAGAVASLDRRDFHHADTQWMLHFDEKGGRSREIPVRHDLETVLFDQGVDTKEIRHLLGHSDPRTTRLYDRTDRRVTRNLVERIRIAT